MHATVYSEKIDRITQLNFITTDLRDNFVFPRENKKQSAYQVTREELIGINLIDVINQSMEEAYKDALSLGMLIKKEDGFTLNINIEGDTNKSTAKDDYFDVEDGIDFHTINEELISETEERAEEVLVRNDLELLNTVEKDIDLKDYTSNYTNKNITIDDKSPYLRVTLPNQTNKIFKKSSFCWLLDEGNGRISNDRLSRFKQQTGEPLEKKTRKHKIISETPISTTIKKINVI